MQPDQFSQRVLRWFDAFGRKNLPWQENPTPYRVWVSEIMLQQTQVTTVIAYYRRFMERFPDVCLLADAPQDAVLHLWSGLGYYARARNLHRAAKIIRTQHDGSIPLDFTTLSGLPGIGRSTAGAILALSADQRPPVLDGNVKRVLARFHALEGWPGRSDVLAKLWDYAERYTPSRRVAAYTQAMMDLGSMVCVRSRPLCFSCPLAEGCHAHAEGREAEFPAPKPKRELPLRQTRMIMARAPDGAVLLEKRPPSGIWGGLWSFPECPMDVDVADWCRDKLGLEIEDIQTWSVLRHGFSHYQLDITPLRVEVKQSTDAVMDAGRYVWYNTHQPDARGLAAPVRRLLAVLANDF